MNAMTNLGPLSPLEQAVQQSAAAAAARPLRDITLYNPEQHNLVANIRAAAAYVGGDASRMMPLLGHAGARAVIVATGPSLDAPMVRQRLRQLAIRRDTVVIAVKQAVALCQRLGLRVDYAVSVDAQGNQIGKTPAISGPLHLVASSCAPALFDHIASFAPIRVFHSACGAVDAATAQDELGLYAALFPPPYSGVAPNAVCAGGQRGHLPATAQAVGPWIANGGLTVVNRATAVAFALGCRHATLFGADFGIRSDGEKLPAADGFYAAGSSGSFGPGKVFVCDGGQLDGRPWLSEPSLVVSARSTAQLIQAGLVTVVGDSLAKSLARNPEKLDRAVQNVA